MKLIERSQRRSLAESRRADRIESSKEGLEVLASRPTHELTKQSAGAARRLTDWLAEGLAGWLAG